jgi:hypothetical protein
MPTRRSSTRRGVQAGGDQVVDTTSDAVDVEGDHRCAAGDGGHPGKELVAPCSAAGVDAGPLPEVAMVVGGSHLHITICGGEGQGGRC